MLWMMRLALHSHRLLSFFTEKVTEIKTNIFVTSFGPVSDTEMVRTSLLISLQYTEYIKHVFKSENETHNTHRLCSFCKCSVWSELKWQEAEEESTLLICRCCGFAPEWSRFLLFHVSLPNQCSDHTWFNSVRSHLSFTCTMFDCTQSSFLNV